MRRGFKPDSLLGSVLNKVLASTLSLAILLGPASASAYDDEYSSRSSYRPQDYRSNTRSQNNFSPSYQLDRQIRNLNAVLSFKQNVGFANPSVNTKPNVLPQDTFKPKILFQLASANLTKPPIQEMQVNQTIQTPVSKPGVFGAIQSIFKGIGVGFQKIGQAIGNAVQRIFTRTDKPGTLSPQQKAIISNFPNLQPTGPNSYTSVGKITVAFGKIWEPGSTFTAKDGNLQLDQGVTLESSFGGIKDKSGGLLPIRTTTVDGAITPVGLEFDRIKPNTVLQVTRPTTIDGFGTIQPGEMTYQGPIKSPTNETIGGRFGLQGVKIDLDRDAADQFGTDISVKLKQANFTLQAGLMRLNSAVLEQGNKRLFVQESKPPLDIQQIATKVDSIDKQSGGVTDQLDNLSKNLENRSLASSVLFNNLAQQSGTEERISFGFSVDYTTLKTEAKTAEQELTKVQSALKKEDYTHISIEQIDQLGANINSLSSKVDALKEQSQPIADFQRSLSGLTAGLRDMTLQGGDVRTMQGAERLTEAELNRRTALYFPEEKAKVKEQTEKAFQSLKSMVIAGQITLEQASITALALVAIRDNLYATKPNNVVAQGINASYDAGLGLVNRAADIMYFDQLNYLAEKFPRTGEAVGTYLLWSAKGAKASATAIGTVGTLYFLGTATASTSVILGTGFLVKRFSEKKGVDEAPSLVLGFLASMGVSKIKPIAKPLATADTKTQLAYLKRLRGFTEGKSGDFIGKFQVILDNRIGAVTRQSILLGTSAGIQTHRGIARQENTPEALTAFTATKNGAKIYRIGTLGTTYAADGQFWSLDNPLTTTGYVKNLGLPANNKVGPETFVIQGYIRPGAPFVTRKAPGIGTNTGGAIEIVANPGDVILDWFHLIDPSIPLP
jgi:hypothetical protein